jgi:predicted alpha/beta superfamily hydrolase
MTLRPLSSSRSCLLAWVFSAAVACTGQASTDGGSTQPADASLVTTPDAAGIPDAGALDAAVPEQDASVTLDASVSDAAQTPDATSDVDAAVAPDAATPPQDAGQGAEDAAVAPDAHVDPPDSGPHPCHTRARDIPSVVRHDVGQMVTLDDFPATALNNTRRVTVLVPPGNGPFPVLYAHDGQNLFDPGRNPFGAEWQLDETAAQLWSEGIRFIVVGIDHGDLARINELTPVVGNGYPSSGLGDLYLDFVANDVKPYIDFHFDTLCEPESTGLMGSSLGGLITFHAYRTQSNTFGRFAAMSTSLWWGNRWAVTQFNQDSARHPGRLWIDNGTDEEDSGVATDTSGWNDMVADSREVVDRALALGHTFGADLGYREAERMLHNELAWAQRLRSVLLFMWGGPLPSSAQAAYVFALRNPIHTQSRTNATLNVAYADGRRFTVPPSLAPLSSSNVSFGITAPGWVVATTAGSTTLTGSYAGVTGTGVLEAQDNAGRAEVIFEVDVPASTPPGDAVFLPGDAAELGAWDPGLASMQHLHGQTWRKSVLLPLGNREYKYTRGSWPTVEVYSNGAELAGNRGAAIQPPGRILVDVVERWKDQ